MAIVIFPVPVLALFTIEMTIKGNEYLYYLLIRTPVFEGKDGIFLDKRQLNCCLAIKQGKLAAGVYNIYFVFWVLFNLIPLQTLIYFFFFKQTQTRQSL